MDAVLPWRLIGKLLPFRLYQPDQSRAPQPLAPAASGRLQIERGSQTSDHFDMVRGLAALGVLVNHLRYLVFDDYAEVAGRNLLIKVFYVATGLGHQMVMVFFVLSGYFIASSVYRDLEKDRWSWRRYLTNRCVRLYVVLIPALLLTWGWDQLGIALSHDAPVYRGLGGQSVVNDVHLKSSLTDLLGNALFLQTLTVPTFGSNGPLWSLSNEFWYYMLFPCLCLVLSPGISRKEKLLALLAGGAIAFGCRELLDLLPVWLLGAGLAYLPRWVFLNDHPRLRHGLLIVATGVFVAALCAARFKFVPYQLGSDYLVGITFALVVYLLLHIPKKSAGGWYAFAARHLAGMSYTLYLVHVPVLAFAVAMLGLDQRWQPTAVTFAYAGGLTLAVMLYAWVISQLTEARTESFRQVFVRLANRIYPSAQSAEASSRD